MQYYLSPQAVLGMRRKLRGTFFRSEIKSKAWSPGNERPRAQIKRHKKATKQTNWCRQTTNIRYTTNNGWHSNYNRDEASLQHGCEMRTFCFVLLSSLAICLATNPVEGKETLIFSYSLKNIPELKQAAQTQMRGCITRNIAMFVNSTSVIIVKIETEFCV